VKTVALLLVLALLLPVNTLAQRKKREKETQTPQAERQAADSHSFMELFTKLERDWMNAAQKKDREALDELLAPEFMMRTAADPEHPVSRAEWIQDMLTNHDVQSYSFRDVTIRAFLGVTVVSFIESQQAMIKGKESSGDWLVVDIWETNHGKWQPAVRFVAPTGKGAR
jgi:hypothetical protein